MVFTVALCLPLCRYLEVVPGVTPQLYGDNLKCVSSSPESLSGAAGFTHMFLKLVGQEAAPRKCVLLSTSKKVCTDVSTW